MLSQELVKVATTIVYKPKEVEHLILITRKISKEGKRFFLVPRLWTMLIPSTSEHKVTQNSKPNYNWARCYACEALPNRRIYVSYLWVSQLLTSRHL